MKTYEVEVKLEGLDESAYKAALDALVPYKPNMVTLGGGLDRKTRITEVLGNLMRDDLNEAGVEGEVIEKLVNKWMGVI